MSNIEEIKTRHKNLKNRYTKYRQRKIILIIFLIPALFFLIGLSVASGTANISFIDVYSALFAKFLPDFFEASGKIDAIIWHLRLPRIVMGILTGLALGSSGAVMQVLLRNPLANPYMLGIASSAAFGASMAIIFNIGLFSGTYLIIGNAFFFSLLASGIILILSLKQRATPETMLLTGLALLFFFQAMTTIIQYFGESDSVKSAIFWSVGDLGKVNWEKIRIVTPIVISGTILLFLKSRALNVLNAGDESAKSLGINVYSLRIQIMTICSVLVATVVSFAGTIGFIGLVAPHIVRMMIGTDNRLLVPASGLVGAALLTLSDTVARTVFSPVILPVGSMTAFLGVPLFLYLIIRRKRDNW